MRLSDNGNVQRELNEDAFHTGQDLKSKQMQQNIEVGFCIVWVMSNMDFYNSLKLFRNDPRKND